MRRVLLILSLAAVFYATVPAEAAPGDEAPVLTFTAPASGILGEPMTLRAALHDTAGTPIPDATLRFLLPTRFLNEFSRVEIGRAVTDENGVALLLYEPRQTGPLTFQVVHDATDSVGKVQVELETTVSGDRQLFIEQIGTDAPNFEVWAVVGVLTIVWLTLLSVALRIHAIALGGATKEPEEPVAEHFREREEWL